MTALLSRDRDLRRRPSGTCDSLGSHRRLQPKRQVIRRGEQNVVPAGPAQLAFD